MFAPAAPFSRCMRQDLIYALRAMRKNPGFTAAVAISIALGIAANTTVFSLTNTLLLGDLDVREPERLVSFGGGRTLPWLDYVDYRDGARDEFESVSAFLAIAPASIGGKGEPERVWGQLTTGNYFETIGAEPVIGRGFLPEEDQAPGRNPVVVLSHGLWKRRFGADSGIVGRETLLNGYPYKVVGVAPPGFHGALRGVRAEFWAPLSMMNQLVPDMNRDRLAASRTSQWLCVNGRLQVGPGLRRARIIDGGADADDQRHQRRGEHHRHGPAPVRGKAFG